MFSQPYAYLRDGALLSFNSVTFIPPPLIGGGIKRCFCLTSDCLSVAYIGPKSRTESPRKTKIGTRVAVHVTRDSNATSKVKKVKITRPL